MLIKERATREVLKRVAEDLGGYIKFVVDVEREILAAGGTRHFEGEELLIREGSRQEDLWGGGFDLETGGIDFDSIINIRPGENNTSREVLDQDIRKKILEIVRRLLK